MTLILLHGDYFAAKGTNNNFFNSQPEEMPKNIRWMARHINANYNIITSTHDKLIHIIKSKPHTAQDRDLLWTIQNSLLDYYILDNDTDILSKTPKYYCGHIYNTIILQLDIDNISRRKKIN